MTRHIALSVLFAACGDFAHAPESVPTVDDSTSSVIHTSRLTPVGGHNGVFFDHSLNAECTVYAVSDTALRCFPRSGYTSLFADAKCTTPVYVPSATSCSGPQDFVLAPTGSFPSYHLFSMWFGSPVMPYTRGEAVARPETFFNWQSGGCTAVAEANLPPADTTVYSLNETETARYASGEVTWKKGATGAIEQPFVTMEGGIESRYFWSFARDTKNDALCSFDWYGDGEVPVARTCALSGTRRASSIYTNATCETQAYGIPATSSPRFVSINGVTYATKVTSSQTAYGSNEEAMCVDRGRYKVLGFEAPLSLAQGETKTQGSGRVLRRTVEADGLSFEDTLLDDKGRPCFEYTFSGTPRCISDVAFGREIFTDAECAQPAVDLYDPPATNAVFMQRGGCGEDEIIRALGEEIAPEQTYERSSYGVCRPSSYVSGNLYTLGAAVAPETFPIVD